MAMQHDAVKPYGQKKGSKKEQVSQMFDNIAPYYDGLNRFLSMGVDRSWRKKAIRMVADAKPNTLLDVATGTADVALALSDKLPDAQITGVDIAAKMLEIGQKKIDKAGKGKKIELVLGDSENLPFADNTYDAVTVAFGVRNFENLEKGLVEIKRVLRPGGCLLVLEFSKPTIFPFKQLFNAYFKYLLPLIGKLTSKDPKAYQYLYESVQAFPDGKQFVDILGKTGYKNQTCIPLSLGICSIYQAQK